MKLRTHLVEAVVQRSLLKNVASLPSILKLWDRSAVTTEGAHVTCPLSLHNPHCFCIIQQWGQAENPAVIQTVFIFYI